jgi:Zn-finger nucleic acid-binding protein
MNCPTCNTELKMADRQGVEIDYCPKCRGVWLDRGELDKIIERSAQLEVPREAHAGYRGDDDDDDRRYGRKKRSFLGDMFDFG